MTRWLVLIVVLTGCTGCSLGKTTGVMSGMGAAATLENGTTPRGAQVEAIAGGGGWYLGAALTGRRVERADDEVAHHGGGLDATIRLSPLGFLADHHDLERYFDFGVEAGAGFKLVKAPPHTLALEGESWVGAWAEVGLFSASDGYVAVTGEVRTIDATDTWTDRPTDVMVGLAWRWRGAPSRRDWSLRD